MKKERTVKTLRTLKASPMPGQTIEPLTIVTSLEIPDFSRIRDTEPNIKRFYQRHAFDLVQAMCQHLPQALIDQVFAELAWRKAGCCRHAEQPAIGGGS